jgi:hypothetical protein
MRFRYILPCALAITTAAAADLKLLPEHVRSDPFGAVVARDRAGAVEPARSLTLEAPRAAYVSCRILVAKPEGGPYRLDVKSPLAVDLFREWYHLLPARKLYSPDALVPVRLPLESQMPQPDNRVAKQSVQSYWLDIWVPASARPGRYIVAVTLDSAGVTSRADVEVRVFDAVVPDADPVAMDHNSYGTSWFAGQYPTLAKRLGGRFYLSDEFFGLIHAYHRLFYEHRGVYHQLGYGHGGKTGPEFAPRLEGSGKTKHVADWSLYDKHFGPLLDGSAFSATRRGARPIPFVYLPVNPEWPASYLWWGEPGYQREFVNVMREVEAHFRSKGWTHTNFELFFNHKKRYKAFDWDGDETRFAGDFPYFAEYARLMRLAWPSDSPVHWVFRSDVSWLMERQFKELAGVINFWVCGGGMFEWYAENAPLLKQRGDIVWTYGGTPTVDEPASLMAVDILRPWILGVDGFVRWQTVLPGPDPWFAYNGGAETIVYPGDRFGIDGPLPSIRLKIQRNMLQDLALLDSLKSRVPLATLRGGAAQRFNGTRAEEWRLPRPPLADTEPLDWSNLSIDKATPKDRRFGAALEAPAWAKVRAYILDLVKEARP